MANGSHAEHTSVPSLYTRAVRQFDNLTTQSQLLYKPYTTKSYPEYPFPVAFQVAPHLGYKPVLPADAPERRTNDVKSNPFANPDPAFVLPFDSDTHTLMLNKYCVYRPQLLLVTKTYRPQYEALDNTDVKAAWDLIEQLEADAEPVSTGKGCRAKTRMLAFYNCGAESGSSQGHKHVQVMPRPELQDVGFDLFPDNVGSESETEIAESIKGVPHKHFVLKLPASANVDDAIRAYRRLLSAMLQFFEHQNWRSPDGVTDPPHNVLLTKDWLCIIPRRDSGIDNGAMANALGMVGVFWITHKMQIWNYIEDDSSHISEYLPTLLGFPA